MTTPDARATAIAWDGDTIAVVGSDEEVQAWCDERGIAPEPLGGRAVIPGFVDAHTHFLHVGVKHSRPDLRGATSRDEALGRLMEWMAANPEGPVIAEGWDEGDWDGDAPPRRPDLDAIDADRPIVMRRICGHVAIANAAALPIVRSRWDDDALVDDATGVLLEQPSLYLNEVLPVSPEGLDDALQAACRVAHRLGVTSLGDYSQAPYRAALLRAAANGTLTVRVASSIYTQDLADEVAAGFRTAKPAPGPDGPSPWLQDGGLKVFLDGSLGGHTALLRERYCDHHGHGMPNWTPEEVMDWFTQAQAAGIQVHAHAIGDGAIDLGLEAFDAVRQAVADGSDAQGPHDDDGSSEQASDAPAFDALRHRFEHYEIVHDDQVARTAELGIVASSQPNFVGEWSAAGGMYEDRLGERYRLNNRFQTFRRAGVRLAFGSDGMPFGALYGIQCAVDHPVPEERLTPQDAVWHMTREAAWSLHMPDVGHLSPGAKADLLVLDVHEMTDKPPRRWALNEVISGGETRGSWDEPLEADLAPA